MICKGFCIYLLLILFSGAENKSFRKVIVKEIRFTIQSKTNVTHAGVKNGFDNAENAPYTKFYQYALPQDEVSRTEYEDKLIKQYQERIHEEPFLNKEKLAIDGSKAPKDQQTDPKHENIDRKHENENGNSNKSDKNERRTNDNDMDKLIQIHDVETVKVDEKSELNELENDINLTATGPIQKIVGGSYSISGKWPWQASIQYFGVDGYWHHFCGGSLVSDIWIITAAHCVSKLEEYTIRVVLGDYRLSTRSIFREQIIDPSRILMHGYYEEDSYYFDIAMVKLSESVRYTNYIQSIEIASPKIDPFTGSDLCYITGWGNTVGTTDRVYTSDYLMETPVTIISEMACRKSYGNIIEDTQICILGDGASACAGDSGGPLVCQENNEWKLAGIASWVGSMTCSPEYPNVYTRMRVFAEWTQSLMSHY